MFQILNYLLDPTAVHAKEKIVNKYNTDYLNLPMMKKEKTTLKMTSSGVAHSTVFVGRQRTDNVDSK